jgi:hypothetical protein
LSIEPDGAFTFIARDGRVITSTLQAPASVVAGVLRAEGVHKDGSAAGGVAAVLGASMARSGDFVLSVVELLTPAGQRRHAVTLSSVADVSAQKTEVLIEEGDAIKKLFAFEQRDEPLWR